MKKPKKLADKKPYGKPIIRKLTEMTFPIDIIEAKTGRYVCKQCSS